MAKIAFLCSGQGSQYPGMGQELYQNFAAARAVYECAGDILGFDLAKTSFEGDEATLARTQISQPAIFAVSLAAYAAVSELCAPAAFGGHSLGEYAALTAAGVFSMEDGFRIIRTRAEAMEKAAAANPGSMFAILGSDEATVEQVCTQTNGFVLPVNYNSPSQTVIAGETAAAQAAADALAGMGAKAVKLAVSSGFHTKLMTGAAEELRTQVSSVTAGTPSAVFYSNVTAGPLSFDTDDTDYAAYFAEHMVSPVRFHAEVTAMTEAGIDTYIELGPNKVLASLIKRGFKQATSFNVENCKTLKKLKAAL